MKQIMFKEILLTENGKCCKNEYKMSSEEAENVAKNLGKKWDKRGAVWVVLKDKNKPEIMYSNKKKILYTDLSQKEIDKLKGE